MDLAKLFLDVPSIEEGRWVTGSEIPALGDIRVKVRGLSSRKAQDLLAQKQRAVPADMRDSDGKLTQEAEEVIWRDMFAEWLLVDIDGAEYEGKPVDRKACLDLMAEPKSAAFGRLVALAIALVDKTTEERAKELSGN